MSFRQRPRSLSTEPVHERRTASPEPGSRAERGAGSSPSDERTIPRRAEMVSTDSGFKRAPARLSSRKGRRSGTHARRGFLAAIRMDEQRPRLAVHHLGADDDLLDRIEARQIIHRVEQDALHDRPEAAGAGLALDRLAG